MQNQSGKIVLILVLFLVLIGAVLYFFLPIFKNQKFLEPVSNYSPAPVFNTDNASKSSKLHKKFSSKDLKISLEIPEKFKIEEKPAILKLFLGDDVIEVTRNETNYDNLQQYLDFFDSKRNLTVLDEREAEIKGYESVRRVIKYTNTGQSEIAQFIYVDNYIYIFSTSEESLYPVLDQIVQSFEYKP